MKTCSTNKPIYITGAGSISPLGGVPRTVTSAYEHARTKIALTEIDSRIWPMARLGTEEEDQLARFIHSNPDYHDLDRVTHFALYAARQAFCAAKWRGKKHRCGVSIGSARGATAHFEKFYREYLEHPASKTAALTSPTTTLGNIASWVGQDLGLGGVTLSHSATCSSALHAVANGVAWLRAGLADRFLVGGAEAALTGFSLSQMRALRLYSKITDGSLACMPLAPKRSNTLVLGEGAAVFALDTEPSSPALAQIEAIGVAQEELQNLTSISTEGKGLEEAMQRALSGMRTPGLPNVLIVHAPGTIQGDSAELRAIQRVFGSTLPFVTSNKWMIGHTFGAAGALSLEFALIMLEQQVKYALPYPIELNQTPTNSSIDKIMLNTAGFGGNAVSLIISRIYG